MPSFLRKLKNEVGGFDSVRQERPQVRARKPKNDDEDDEPTYVDESNDMITKAEYEAMVNGGDDAVKANPLETSEPAEKSGELEVPVTDQRSKQEVLAVIGGPGKRKLVKVVGDEEQDASCQTNGEKSSEKLTRSGKKAGKKAKKVKLSFDQDIEA